MAFQIIRLKDVKHDDELSGHANDDEYSLNINLKLTSCQNPMDHKER